ncbi:MAG: pseudouridine synthase [Eubacteriales bacterium]
MRLDQFLSLASVGTRKKVREYIYAGNVKVNHALCTLPAEIIDENKDVISYNDTIVDITPVYYVLNKPQGHVTARELDRPNVFDCFQDIDTMGLFAVGRLDKDTEGLLIITNDGTFSNDIMAPDNHVEKTYQFLALGKLTTEHIDTLESGIDIGTNTLTKPANVSILQEGLYRDLSRQIGSHKMKKIKKQPEDQAAFIGEITITEGKKHQVKRMLREVGCPIIYLKRTAIGDFELPEDLGSGDYLEIPLLKLLTLINR